MISYSFFNIFSVIFPLPSLSFCIDFLIYPIKDHLKFSLSPSSLHIYHALCSTSYLGPFYFPLLVYMVMSGCVLIAEDTDLGLTDQRKCEKFVLCVVCLIRHNLFYFD